MARSLQRNAADPDQVGYAGRKERERQAQFKAALTIVLGAPAGRLVLATLLEDAGLFNSVFDMSQQMMAFREGRRNFGLELQAACVAADERLSDLMEQERRARVRADSRESAAVQMTTAGDNGE
jgi:hypothetical protein